MVPKKIGFHTKIFPEESRVPRVGVYRHIEDLAGILREYGVGPGEVDYTANCLNERGKYYQINKNTHYSAAEPDKKNRIAIKLGSVVILEGPIAKVQQKILEQRLQ